MNNKFAIPLAPLALILGISGCASIVSDSSYPVSVTSAPEGADFEIRNRSGKVVHTGMTPGTVSLRAGAGYFKGEQYTVSYKKDGYTSQVSTLDSSLDGWYWGNILFGGLIGLFAVDPATGAMFKLPESASVSLPAAITEQKSPAVPLTSQAE
ncbi:hypothetical protein L1F06_005640 [Ectopseudomonas hydrolytica]|uniref:PEGA domain-containing protein n=1 Tax=Ectopseudomonas hydrolytica TaxID=2493633 RepID=A0ABY5AB68_9GAMM|nr:MULTISPECIES: hypothetical protein [Pseudomonas]MDH0097583.1 hypothetical protein [Pseudomonas sp. GD04158]USR40923.1 hypothetical protein L1F06_005640 [Pseudomonas hydrolytica]